jgi:hypothetical protein
MAVKIGILFNCQHESLAVALGGVLPSAEIVSFELNNVISDLPGRDRIAAILQGCDHVISQDISPGYGPLETRVLSRTVRNFHLIPAFHFGGFHPDTVSIRLDHVPIDGPAGGVHSRIVTASYLAGLSPAEAGDLFNPLVFGRLGYFDAMAENSALLLEKYGFYGIDLTEALAKWMQTGCFMYSTHHPKLIVFLDLARIACAMMGLAPEAAPRLTSLRDPMAAFPTLPFLPALAARFGMRPDGAFRGTLPSRPLSLPEFIEALYKALARTPLCCLRQGQGVMDAVAILGLKPASRTSTQLPGTHCLLSRQGTLVRADISSNLLIHEPLLPENPDCADFTLTPVTGPDGVISAAVIGGVQIVPGAASGTVSLRRRGAYVSVEPGRLAVPLNRATANIWEQFVLLTVAQAADLREIMARDWRTEDGDSAIPAAIIAMKPNFVLDFGAFTMDLAVNTPVRLTEGPGVALPGVALPGFALQGSAGAHIIRPDPGTQIAETALRQAPKTAYPDEAGSLPAFRAATHQAFTLEGGDEVLHLPLTMCPAHAQWLFDRFSFRPAPLPLGPGKYGAKMQRMPHVTMLTTRGLEGVLLNRHGVLKDHATLATRRHITLPAGLRMHGDTMLMAHGMAFDATPVSGPSVVAVTPNMQGYDQWLLHTAMPLHIMAPYLPPGAKLLMPASIAAMADAGKTALDHVAVLEAIGLGGMARLEVDGPARVLSDAIWLDNINIGVVPAAMLARFRDQVAALYPVQTGPRLRIHVQGRQTGVTAPNPALEEFLAAQGFTSVVPEDLTPAEQIRLFLHADMVVGAHGAGMANLLFCPPGTRVLEMAPLAAFRPQFWMIAEKLGLAYGVLPCPAPGGMNGALTVDFKRFRALYRMLRFFSI